MKQLRLASLAAFALTLAAAPAAAQPEGKDERPIVVQGQARAVAEIERILEADNLDTGTLTTREVVETIHGIPRGGAPDDFWTAYQAHVRAWERFAAAEAEAETFQSGKREGLDQAVAELEAAEQGVGSSFAEVERVARRYGAQLPTPIATDAAVDLRDTV